MDAAKTTTPASDLVAAATTGVRLALRRDMRNCETFEAVRADGPSTIVVQLDGREYRITVTRAPGEVR